MKLNKSKYVIFLLTVILSFLIVNISVAEDLTPEQIALISQSDTLGSLTPQEIEAGRRLLEQQAPNNEVEISEISPPENIIKEPPPVDEEGKKGVDIFQQEKEEISEKATVGNQFGQRLIDSDNDFFSKQEIPARPDLDIFGHKFFTMSPSTFAPIKNLPISDDYIIGPGDEIRVFSWGRVDGSYTLVVDNEGVLNIPQVESLPVAGLTFCEVKMLLKKKLESITGVNIAVSMGKLRVIQIFVLGEVSHPGVYTVSSLATMANALLVSGGPTVLGSMRNIELKRKNRIISTLDFYKFLLKGDTASDVRLMPGDVIFIPQAGSLVKVLGNVKRPAIYEFKEDASLQAALELGGGLAPRAYDQRIQINRAVDNKMQMILDISYKKLRRKEDIQLQDGDIIEVFSILKEEVNAVFLYGNVMRPGLYAYEKGLHLRDIIPDITALDEDTYMDYALIKRYNISDMKSELIPFSLEKLIHPGDKSYNIPVMPLDDIYIFNKWMFQDRPYTEVKGEVREPGTYQIQDMKITDIIKKAGDLTDSAYLNKVEIIRTNDDQSKKTIYINLSEAFAGDPDHNIFIKDRDIVIVHSMWEEKWKEFVTIEGEVKNPGEYMLTENMTVKDLIFKAGSFTREVYASIGHIYRIDWKTRDLTIKTFNAEKAMEGDELNNILLKDLDKVAIHSIKEFVTDYNVSITGMVNNPGEYPWAKNMTVKDLIMVGGNLADAAYLDEAELVRYNIIEGKKVETLLFTFNAQKAMENDPSNNLSLEPMDVITIKEIPEWREKKKTVTISGEVLFPGTYQIRREEKLSDIIERAGNFTEMAYPEGSVFTRESVKEVQKKRLNEMINQLEVETASYSSSQAQSTLSVEDKFAQEQFLVSQKLLLSKLREAGVSGRLIVSIDSPDLMRKIGSDMIIEDGDNLYIPRKSSTINILGAVYNPSSVIYREDRTELQNYLAMVGGITKNADKKEMYIVRADGTVISKRQSKSFLGFGKSFKKTKLLPGDTILVPHKVVRPSFLKGVKDVSEIVFQLAVTAGVIITQVF